MRIWHSGLIAGWACLCLAPVSVDGATLRIDENDGAIDGDGRFSWVEPLFAGSTVWFDVLIHDAMGESADAAKITLTVEPVAHGGSLAFDEAASEAVETVADYWLFGNSLDPAASDRGSNIYDFQDSADVLPPDPLADEDIVARFAFTWDGVVGDYLVTIDTSTDNTYLFQNFQQEAPAWAQDPVTLHVPEPTAFAILACGTVSVFRRRRF